MLEQNTRAMSKLHAHAMQQQDAKLSNINIKVDELSAQVSAHTKPNMTPGTQISKNNDLSTPELGKLKAQIDDLHSQVVQTRAALVRARVHQVGQMSSLSELSAQVDNLNSQVVQHTHAQH